MAPFSRPTGRWCPLLKLQAEFPKEAFHEPERPQLPPELFPVSREPSLLAARHLHSKAATSPWGGRGNLSSVPSLFLVCCPSCWG